MKANHTCHVIWSERIRTWIAVSEISRAWGKRSGRAVCLALPLALLAINASGATPTTVVPSGGQTTAYTSANGTPVVNINAANRAGLSHNEYLRYDVDSKGLVLNNGNCSQIERQSQLAGSVLANPNLNKEASVILNEVVSTNRSTLAGFTEVVGGKADVVVANPNGITCSGCGFINSDRATLTTGTPQFMENGYLAGFNVTRGDILVEGNGLNASGQQILDLVARSVKVDGPINTSAGGSLQMVTGANNWNYGTRDVTGTGAGTGQAPSYAIDSTALGGMYSGRIRMIATEAGVGVKMLGEVAASADDFSLTSAGRVVIDAHLSAKRDMAVSTTGNGADITLASADTHLSAGRDLTVSTAAGSGGSIDNEGLLLAGGKLNVGADASIINGSNAAMSGLGELAVSAVTGDITNAGWLYSGGQLTAHAENGIFANTSTGTIWADGSITGGSNIFLNNNWMQAAGDIAITTKTRFSNEFEGARTLTKLDDNSTASYSGYYELNHSKESGIHVYFDNIYVWAEDKTVKQKFDQFVPTYTEKPVAMVAGNSMTIDSGAGTFNNTGAVLSAGHNLTITGTGSASNDSLYLDTNKYEKRWAYHNYDYGLDEYDFFAVTTDAQFAAGYPHYVGSNVIWPSPNWYHVGYINDDTSAYHFYWNQAQADAIWYLLGKVGTSTTVRDAVIHAGGTITVSGFHLNNNGSRVEGSPSSYGHPDNSKSQVPTNLNGYFVPAKNSSAKYLIETNPLYGLGSDYAGSDYLLKSLGIDPETTEKRLGDANYEAYLIRQQLISQTGSAVLNGYASEAQQMERLMDQAVGESKSLGLTLGKALTADQIANLKQDMVWMVETTVSGQKVLQPVVYLAPESRKEIASGAVISGKEVNMKVASLTNTGGTVSGSDSLHVTSQDDITNTSGAITGGKVSLESTEGSIVNRTYSEGRGDASSNYMTTVGKKAAIEATGDLDVHAAKDIDIRGAEVKAGGTGSLTADNGNITVDTIVDKSTTTTRTSGSTGFLTKTGPTTTITATEKNIGSTISIGGNLILTSTGGNATLAGSTADIKGDLTVNTGGNFNILSRQDKTTVHSEGTTSGIGVGGGLWGTEKMTIDDFTGTNFGSSITVGGNAGVTAGKDMTLQGSNLNIGGTGTVVADSVKIEQGLDERHTVTTTEATTFLSTGGKNDSHSGTAASAETGNAAAEASAGANAGVGESHELNLMEKRTTTVDHDKISGVGSNLSAGGNLDITARDTVRVVGSNVESGGDLNVNAQKKIDVEAGENKETTTTTSKATKIGFYTDSKADASASAEAGATGMSASAKAEAEAKAEADSTVTIGARLENSTETTTAITHTKSTLKSGRDMTLEAGTDSTDKKKEAQGEARFVGADIEAGGDLKIEAKDITNLSAQDSTITTSDRTKRTMGLYLDASGSAEAEGSAKGGLGNLSYSKKAGIGSSSASVGASAEGEVGAGVYYSQEHQTGEQGEITNVVNTFKAGGDITRKATLGTITDQGTQLEAGGDIRQKTTTLKEIKAEDKTWSSESSEKHDAKLGVYAGGSVEGEAAGQRGLKGGDGVKETIGPDASAGISAKYSYEGSTENESETHVKTSSYKAGGSIHSTSAGDTTLIGTRFQAGENVTIKAGSLDYQAAHDTTSHSSTERSGSVEVKAKLTGTTGAELGAGYDQSSASGSSDTARAGSISAGGKVQVTTTGDARFEGTEIGAEEKVGIKSKSGNVTFDAAKSTTHEESQGVNVGASFGSYKEAAKPGKEGGETKTKTSLSGGYSNNKSDTMVEEGARISSGKVNITADKDVTMHGTEVEAEHKANVTAGGNVNLLEAKENESSSSFGVSGHAQQMKTDKHDEAGEKTQMGGVNVNYENEDKQKGLATSITSEGELTIKGKNITFQEAELKAKGTKTIEGTVTEQKLTDEESGVKINAGVDILRKKDEPKAKE